MQKVSVSRRAFVVANTTFMLLVMCCCVLPFLHIFWASLSLPSIVRMTQGILLYPKGFQIESYKLVFGKDTLLSGYRVTLFVTFVGTAISLVLTALGAYVLSKRGVFWNKVFIKVVTIPMFISGGLIPFYLLVDGIGLNGSIWALILPYCMSTWNMMIMRASFRAIPESIQESTRIDGADEWTILLRIALPLSLPVVAVMVLFYSIGYWNSWFPASIFIRKRNLYPLQLIMRELLMMQNTTAAMGLSSAGVIAEMSELNAENYVESLKYTTIIVATLPILCVYPFLQKYFVKGVLVGSLKE